MPKLPINVGKNKNIDEVGLTTHGACMVDAYVDASGFVNRKPGYTEFCDFLTGASVDGLYWWSRESSVIGVSGTRCFRIASDGSFTEFTGDAFQSGNRVKFADFGTALYGANGEHIIKIWEEDDVDILESVYDEYDTDSPATVTHLAFVDNYLLANEVDTQKIWWAQVGDPDDWQSNWSSATYKPDNVVAIGSSHGTLEVMGKTTLEPWYNSITTFAPLRQAYTERGTVAKYSFVWAKDRWMWLDNYRSVVSLNGRTPTQFSITLDRYLQLFRTVHDAVGDYIPINGKPYYILRFPTDGKTIVCDLESNNWYEWGWWDSKTAEYREWRGNCGCFAQEWNKTLIGDRASGKVYAIDVGADDDGGNAIRWMVRTPQIDYGKPSQYKFCSRLDVYFKKTDETNTVSTPKVSVKWRDDGETVWRGERIITLQPSGQTGFIGHINRLGRYRTRQYEFSAGSGFPPLAFVEAEETL